MKLRLEKTRGNNKTLLEKTWDNNKTLIDNLSSIFNGFGADVKEHASNGFKDKRYDSYEAYKATMNENLKALGSKDEAELIKSLELCRTKVISSSFRFNKVYDSRIEQECLDIIDLALKKIFQAQKEKEQVSDRKIDFINKKIGSLWSQDKNLLENIRYIFEQDFTLKPSRYDQNGFYNKYEDEIKNYKSEKRRLLIALGVPDALKDYYGSRYDTLPKSVTLGETAEKFYETLTIELYRLDNRVNKRELCNELATKINFAIKKMELDDPSLIGSGPSIIKKFEEEIKSRENDHLAY